ncbi:chalcone isomerase family protein [Idiomarina xiamenensis]|uniref:Chalcone isomerase domain-containing protein n=1 Tax=Idiomarina xiamenensis 10-D-4 TaxID=740709 RepID=K2KJM4_9GAMM|nr:chalcone isomerase family protein [Idiomarina xiamenensis]EKE86907.1 hypothetical protein A10D4_01657 [Idiomarina xiamenensis 10-D-4]
MSLANRKTGYLSALAILLVSAWQSNAQAQSCQIEPLSELKKVGETRLSVWLWDVYDATLYTAEGNYPDGGRRALQLVYLRDIKAADLIETTEEEWQKQGIAIDQQAQQWLKQLTSIWPDVNEGDCLVLVEGEQGEAIFYNAEKRLGEIDSQRFTDDFLAIWLSEKSRFKEERQQLIGAQP